MANPGRTSDDSHPCRITRNISSSDNGAATVAIRQISSRSTGLLESVIDRSSALISKALSVAANASDEDRQEIDRLVKDLEEASAVRSVPQLKQVGAELEDLVFYLQDA